LSNLSHINVAGSTVPLAESIKLLGVTLDKNLTFHKHVNQISQSCHYHMKALRHIRHCLDDHTASLIAHALISSRLDYANSILIGSPGYVIHKLQRIQNSLARILSFSLIAKPTRSLFFDSCIGSLSTAEFVSSLPLSHIKPFPPTPRNTSLHSSTTINLSVLFAPLTNTTFSQLKPPLILVLAHSAALLLSFGTQFLSTSAHHPPLMSLNVV
jgi:hypothetical protein